jgi:hypothetical protein
MRGDIIKTMHRAFTDRGQDRGIADYVIDADTAPSPITATIGAAAQPGADTSVRNPPYTTHGRAWVFNPRLIASVLSC